MFDIDHRIHEQIMGKCWHEREMFTTNEGEHRARCSKCKARVSDFDRINPSYLDWQHYGPMLEKLQEHNGRWRDFQEYLYGIWVSKGGRAHYSAVAFSDWKDYILHNPARGCEAVDKFFCKEGK